MKRRKLGQHYLIDQKVIRRIVEAAGILPHERVLEIGTGQGALTKELVGLGGAFEGFEVDKENYEKTLAVIGEESARIHMDDVFLQQPDFDVLVASLPYSRSATFIEWLSGIEYDRAVVLLQKEFVKKILAIPGTRDYRAVSALAQISSEVRVLGRVGRASFSPPPKVSSLLVSVRPKLRISESEVSNVKRLFSLRRREVASALTKLAIVRRKEDYGRRRIYSLKPEEVHRLCSSDRAE